MKRWASLTTKSRRFQHGPLVDQVFADEDSGGNVLWLLSDHQGSIRDVADYDETTDTTSVVEHRTFSSFRDSTSLTRADGTVITDQTALAHIDLENQEGPAKD